MFGPFAKGERINSACIEHGKRKTTKEGEVTRTQVLGLRLFTNRGRALIARALKSKSNEDGSIVTRDDIEYENVKVSYIDMPLSSGSIIGFYGKSDDGLDGKIYRLGLIWCKMPELTVADAEVPFADVGDTVDSEDFALLKQSQVDGEKTAKEKLTITLKVCSVLDGTLCFLTIPRHSKIAATESPSSRKSARVQQPWRHSVDRFLPATTAGGRAKTPTRVVQCNSLAATRRRQSCSTASTASMHTRTSHALCRSLITRSRLTASLFKQQPGVAVMATTSAVAGSRFRTICTSRPAWCTPTQLERPTRPFATSTSGSVKLSTRPHVCRVDSGIRVAR